MLGFSQGEMKAGTPYQDLLGQAAKSANLGREEIRSKYQFEADKANQDTMLALLDKFGIGGGVGGSAGGGDQRSYRGAMESAAGGGTGGDPTRDPSSIWYNDAHGYKEYLAKQKGGAMGTGNAFLRNLQANEPATLPRTVDSSVTGGEFGQGFYRPKTASDWAREAYGVDLSSVDPETFAYIMSKFQAQKQAEAAKKPPAHVVGPSVSAR
jgi:hypothetical protein